MVVDRLFDRSNRVFRAVIGLVPTLTILSRPPGLLWEDRRVGAHLLRGVVGLIGTFGFCWALGVPAGSFFTRDGIRCNRLQ